jgi:hypothetical protein
MTGEYTRAGTVDKVYLVTSLGGGLNLKRKRKLDFTHDEAWRMIHLEEFPGDRRLKQSHVDYLVKTMKRGTFHSEWVSLITCSLGNKVFRMNGQHTAWARLEMPPKWKCEVVILEYEAKNEEDVRTLYSSIDRASPRTKANVIESYLVGSEEFKDMKNRTLRVVPQGFALWEWPSKHDRNTHDGDDIAYLLKTDRYDLALKVCTFLDKQSPREQRHMFRAPVVAALFATFNRAPQVAVEFWSPVADGLGLEKRGDPRLKLRNELMQSAVNAGSGAMSDKKKVSQEFMYRLCINAWNAHRQTRTLQILKATERGRRTRVA